MATRPGKCIGWDLPADAFKHGLGISFATRVYLLATRQAGWNPGDDHRDIDSDPWTYTILARDYAAVGFLAAFFVNAVPKCLAKGRFRKTGVGSKLIN